VIHIISLKGKERERLRIEGGGFENPCHEGRASPPRISRQEGVLKEEKILGEEGGGGRRGKIAQKTSQYSG